MGKAGSQSQVQNIFDWLIIDHYWLCQVKKPHSALYERVNENLEELVQIFATTTDTMQKNSQAFMLEMIHKRNKRVLSE